MKNLKIKTKQISSFFCVNHAQTAGFLNTLNDTGRVSFNGRRFLQGYSFEFFNDVLNKLHKNAKTMQKFTKKIQKDLLSPITIQEKKPKNQNQLNPKMIELNKQRTQGSLKSLEKLNLSGISAEKVSEIIRALNNQRVKESKQKQQTKILQARKEIALDSLETKEFQEILRQVNELTKAIIKFTDIGEKNFKITFEGSLDSDK